MDPATLLRESRRRAGLTQREVAERAGTSAAAVCLYEQGQRVPRVDTLARLIAATGATLAVSATASIHRLDLEANARTLEDLLELADHLPKRSGRHLLAPPFASLARAGE